MVKFKLVTILYLIRHLFIKSSNKYFLNIFNVSDIIPGTREYKSEQNMPNLCPSGAYILLGKQTIKKEMCKIYKILMICAKEKMGI